MIYNLKLYILNLKIVVITMKIFITGMPGVGKTTTIRKLATKVNIEELVTVAKADFLGRTTQEALSGVYRAGEWLLHRAKELQVNIKPIKPILKGQDLISLGLAPSKEFKTILNRVYNAQIEGEVSNYNEAILFVKSNYLDRASC